MNKRRTLNHSIIYILGSGIQAVIPFFIIPSLTRNVSQSNFGLLMVMISLGTVMSFVFSFGIPIVLTRELVFDKSNANTYKNLALKIFNFSIKELIVFDNKSFIFRFII